MSSTASPAGVECGLTRRTAVAVVVLVLVGALALAFAPGIASADDSLERDGSDLVINVSDVDNPETVTVEVTDPADPGIIYTADATNAESDMVHIDVTEPDEGSVNGIDLRSSVVTVTVDRSGGNATAEELENGTSVPLHAVEIASDRPTWIDSEGDDDNATNTLHVPLDADRTVGFPGEDAVDIDLDIDGSGTSNVTGTVHENGTQLTADHHELIDAAGDSRETLDLRVLSGDGPVIDDPSIEPELRSTHDGLAVWHPLFDDDGSYAVNAVATESDTSYTDTAAETTAGYLDVSMLPAGDVEIRVTDATDGTVLVNNTDDPLRYDGPHELNAVVGDAHTLSFGPSLAGLTVDGILAGSDDDAQYAAVDARIDENGELTLDESTLDGVEVSGGSILLLSPAAGELSVALETGDTAGADGGSLFNGILPLIPAFLIPLVVGLVPGTVLGKRSEDAPDLVQTSLISVIGFSLASLGALSILWVLLPDLRPMGTIHFVGLGGVLVGTIVGGITHQWLGSQSAASVDAPFAARVTVTDGSDLFSGDVTVHYRKPDGREQSPVTVRGGRERIQRPGSGTWELYARHGAARSAVKSVDGSDPAVTLTIPVETSLTVVDASDDEPLPDVTARTENGVVGTTDQNGTIIIEPSEDGSDVDVELSHDRYADATQRVRFQQGASSTVALDRRNGQLRATTRIDGEPAGPVPLRIVPDDGFLRDRFEAKTLTTDADGRLSQQEVPIGQYRVESGLTDTTGLFDERETAVQVRESGTATADVDVQFTWRLDPSQRDRIDRVRADVRSIADGGGRDGAIPRYYASVVDSMLDAADSVPDAGHEFVGRDVTPDAAVDAILAAAERATDAVSEAMTTKRNIDLFAACSDMPDPQVRWEGTFELGELLGRLEPESGAQRREVKQRYEAVDGLIEERRGGLSEVTPAREMQQRAWELTRATDRGPDAVAIGYTSLLLLDAVEQLFEHDALRERLTRTVF